MNPNALKASAEFVDAAIDGISAANVHGSRSNNPLTTSPESKSIFLRFSSGLEFFAAIGVISCIGFCILLIIYHKKALNRGFCAICRPNKM